jgi:eukaryotic-like serine/threonine-protein kinase
MVSPASHGSVYRFGTFEVFARTREIFRRGRRIKLQDQPFELLLLLLENSGGVVDRENIRQRLWPDNTFVDFGQSLGTAVTKLRQALDDDAENPRFIETIPRHGYRFIAPVTADNVTPPAATVAAPATVSPAIAPVEAARQSSPQHRNKWQALLWIVAVAAIVAVGTAIYLRSRWPVFALAPQDTVVLADFENTTGEPIFNDTLRQGLIVGLAQSPIIHILPDRKSAVIFRQMGHSPDDRLTGRLAIDLCRRVGGKVAIQGSIASLGTNYLIGLAAIRCDTGKPVAREEAEAAQRNEVIDALGKATARMRAQLGESLPSIQKYNAPLEQATTASLDALQAYGTALSTWDAHGDLASVPYFKRAIGLDPNFAMAYSALSAVYNNLGEADLARDSTIRAYKLRDRVTETERASIDARYYLYVTEEIDKAAQTYDMLVQEYPDSAGSLNHVGTTDLRLGRDERAIESFRKALALDATRATTYGNLAVALMHLNRIPEAASVLAAAEQRGLRTDYLLQVNYWLAFLRSDRSAMDRVLHQSAGMPGAAATLLLEQAHTEAYHGRLQKAQSLALAAGEQVARDGDKDSAALFAAQQAVWEMETGSRTKARSLIKQAQSLRQSKDVLTLAALVYAGIGDRKQALSIADALNKEYPNGTFIQNYWLPIVRAKLALSQKNAADAVNLLARTRASEMGSPTAFAPASLYPAYARGQAALAAGDGKSADEEFQFLLDHPGMVLNLPFAPLARLGRARAYALSGQLAEARDAYQKFFAAWKDADPDTPILHQAHQEFARLTEGH